MDSRLQFAIAFASSVVVQTEKPDWVARNGSSSLFDVFRQIFPEVNTPTMYTTHVFLMGLFCIQACQSGSRKNPVKGKIARPEFNKAMKSQCGFRLGRSRKKNLSRSSPRPIPRNENLGHASRPRIPLLSPLKYSSAILLQRHE